VHELKLDGYRIHARIDRGEVKLLTRSGLDWSPRYGATAEALKALKCERASLDGKLCAVRPLRLAGLRVLRVPRPYPGCHDSVILQSLMLSAALAGF
jgi:ATP-dependent DNA ligase